MRRLDRKKFRPYLYTFRAGDLLRQVRRLGIPVLVGYNKAARDESWRRRDALALERYQRQLIARLRKDRIDVCLIYGWRDGVQAAQEARVRGIVERVDGFELISRVRDKSPCNRIICQAKAIRDILLAQRNLLRCRREQIIVISNGIDLRRFDPSGYDRERCRRSLGLAPGDFVVGSVGRLAPQKNLTHLLDAVKLLVKENKREARIRAIIAGPDGGSLRQLRAHARQLGIAKNVRFIGARSDVPRVLRALDVFAMTSFHEGTPFALLEAMAMGLPIIGTQVGAIPETIDGNGYLVCVTRPVQTFYALRDMLANPGLRQRLGARSRKLAVRYDVEEMVRGYERVLLDAVRKTPRARRRGRGKRPRLRR